MKTSSPAPQVELRPNATQKRLNLSPSPSFPAYISSIRHRAVSYMLETPWCSLSDGTCQLVSCRLMRIGCLNARSGWDITELLAPLFLEWLPDVDVCVCVCFVFMWVCVCIKEELDRVGNSFKMEQCCFLLGHKQKYHNPKNGSVLSSVFSVCFSLLFLLLLPLVSPLLLILISQLLLLYPFPLSSSISFLTPSQMIKWSGCN